MVPPMSSYRWAATDGTIHFRGMRIRLQPGQVWDGDDPLVRERPELFSTQPPSICTTGGRGVEQRPVESASKAPGEKRATRRTETLLD